MSIAIERPTFHPLSIKARKSELIFMIMSHLLVVFEGVWEQNMAKKQSHKRYVPTEECAEKVRNVEIPKKPPIPNMEIPN